MNRARSFGAAGWALLLASVVGCATATSSSDAFRVATPRAFDYVAIDGARLSTESTRGRATVLAFIATYDMGSQVVTRQMAELLARHRPRINAGAIVLEPPKNAPLVEAFASTLELPFPVALADAPTLEARGPFGEVRVVPTVVVLNARGDEVWRSEGAVSTTDLEHALERAAR